MSRRSSALWKFLESSGALAIGTDDAIAIAKRAYWKQYHYNHRRNQRNEKPEVTIGLSKTDGTYDRFSAAAKKHHMTLAAFIRTAATSYLEQTYIVPDRTLLVHLEGILAQCANELQAVAGVKEKYFWQRDHKIESMEARIGKLEQEIHHLLAEPPNLDQEIIKACKQSPETRVRLLALLTFNDHQDKIKEE